MSLILAAALALSPTCSWDNPGRNPFAGDVVQAVDHFTDLSPEVRTELKKKMAARKYDDLVTISRNAIAGKDQYEPEITNMHFGKNQMCANVTRTKWNIDTKQMGLVYCVEKQCVLVPTICRNVSQITKKEEIAGGGGGTGGTGGSYHQLPMNLQPQPVPTFVFAPPQQELPSWIGSHETSNFPPFKPFDPWGGGDHSWGPGPGWHPGWPPHVPTTPVPEPYTWSLLLLGLGFIYVMTRKK